MTVVFYISGHGFGHASRQVEIIHALVRQRPGLRIIIRSAVNPGLLQRTLSVPFELRPGACDTGIVQASSIQHDDPATVREAAGFYSTYDERIRAEVGGVGSDRVDLIVGDIAPLAFEVAAQLQVPGVAIGNFTWDWIYETHPGLTDALPDLVPRLRDSYRKALLALELAFAGGFEVFRSRRAVGLVARRASRAKVDTRGHFNLPRDGRVALLSFGGYGLPQLDLPSLDCLSDWTIVTTDRIAAPTGELPASVRLIPETAFIDSGFRYEDLVAAADVVITKPGYGIIAECMSTKTAMLYTSRGQFREYALLVRELPRYVRSRFIAQPDLLEGRWASALAALIDQPPAPESMPADGAETAARALSDVLDASR